MLASLKARVLNGSIGSYGKKLHNFSAAETLVIKVFNEFGRKEGEELTSKFLKIFCKGEKFGTSRCIYSPS